VSFCYLEPPSSSALRQGEILLDVLEYRPTGFPKDLDSNPSIEFESVNHRRVFVVSQDCDLLSDYKVRPQQASGDESSEHSNVLPHVVLCEVYEGEEIRFKIGGSDLWRRIKQNQDERYHCLPEGPIGDGQSGQLPELFLDFKKTLSLPTGGLYQAIGSGAIRRIAVVPPYHMQGLVHRLYSFHGRVALSE